MKGTKTLRLFFTFYNTFFAASFFITLGCALSTLQGLGVQALIIIVWFKLLTLGVFVLYINGNQQDQFYYYKNLGVSKAKLWLVTLGADLAIFTILLIMCMSFR